MSQSKPSGSLFQAITEPINTLANRIFSQQPGLLAEKVLDLVHKSDYISRDLSWVQFNYRVLAQARNLDRNIWERLKFLAITASNFDEFFMIRVGSLYNYLDYNRERIDYSGLREKPFKSALFTAAHEFSEQQNLLYVEDLEPEFAANGFAITKLTELDETEMERTYMFFKRTVYPMLTPMSWDLYHTFPILNSKALTFGVVTQNVDDQKNPQRLSFVQIPQNLPRFYEITRGDKILFIPLEEIIRWQMPKLFKNIEIKSVNLFRILRNGDISIEESDDLESDFAEDVKRRLAGRRTGRVVRIEVEDNYSSYLMKILRQRWDIDYDNIFVVPKLMDFTGLWQIINHPDFKEDMPIMPHSVPPMGVAKGFERDMFEVLRNQDIMLHHPYNNMDPLIALLEQASEDPNVLSIKLTIYRLGKNSRIVNALDKAAQNGKYVSVLFEVKARFDEENNIREAKRLEKAGCFVIYGVGSFKTHTKLCLIVRKEDDKVTRYVHMSSGNYNEATSRMYTDVSILSTNEVYANDISEFFNVITGHSIPDRYQYLITAPRDMRTQLLQLIAQEAENARLGLPCGIVIKINSLEDKDSIDALYAASQAGVPVKLIIRGICCLRPQRQGLSENIIVRSIVGEYLEHTRLYYFHNNGNPKIYGGSADMMVRSFDRRVESLFLIVDEQVKRQAINILAYNFRDNVNSFEMTESGDYIAITPKTAEDVFNIHRQFYKVTELDVAEASLF
jgi:polyphosphate kinase